MNKRIDFEVDVIGEFTSKFMETENRPMFDKRPWGSFTVLEEGAGYKVKSICVLPGKRLSYQKHAQRCEHWIVVQGSGIVTLNGENQTVKAGDKIDVPQETSHRIQNSGTQNLVFIEVQRGSYLGEDDIIRFEDDFGRAH